jgi:hypothetical protein
MSSVDLIYNKVDRELIANSQSVYNNVLLPVLPPLLAEADGVFRKILLGTGGVRSLRDQIKSVYEN